MVTRILSFINRESGGLHQAAFLLAFFAFLSQILGLLRDRLLAHSFGAGTDLDLYYAAFRLPDFIFVSVASLVSVSVLIPALVEKLNNQPEAKKFVDTVFSFFFLIIIIFCLLIFAFTPFILRIVFPGFSEDLYGQLVTLTRVLLLSPIFLGFSNLLASITQSHRRFMLYALSPIIYNSAIILGIIFLTPYLGILGVAWGVVLGAFGHFIIQVPFVVKVGLLPKFIFKFFWRDIKNLVLLSLPRTLALSANHLSLLILFSLASLLVTGSIAIFSLSFNLQSVPLSIIGVSYSLAAFPTLAILFSNGQRGQFIEQIIISAKHIIFWSLPVAVLFVVLRAQIVRVILGSGKFSWSDTRLVAACLAIFAVSVVFQGLNLLFVRGYYAAGNTKKPLFINIVSSLSIIIFSFLFIKIFQQSDFFRFFMESLFRIEGLNGSIVIMLALGYSLGTILNGFLLWIAFHREFGEFSKRVSGTFFQSFSAAVIIGFVSYLFLQFLAPILNTATLLGIFLQGFLAGLAGIGVGILVLWGLGNQEIKEVWKAFHRKLWKGRTDIVGSDPEIV
jgi:putative peptidoglycan lipid II flippase